MNRFNLTFSGEIQQGEKPDAVKLRFAKKFAIDDPDRLARFFSGKEIILRRNLDRKEAAECFQEMHQIGVVAALVKIAEDEDSHEKDASPSPEPPAKNAKKKRSRKPAGKDKADAPASKARGEQRDRERRAEKDAEAQRQAADNAAREQAEAREQAMREQAEREAEAQKQHAAAALRETAAAAERRLEADRARRRVEEEAADAAAREREAAARSAEAAARDAAALEKARAEAAEHARDEEARRRAGAEAALQEAEEARATAAREAQAHERARREAEAEAARCAEREAEALRRAKESVQRAETQSQRAEEAQREAEELARQNAALAAEHRAATERAASLEAALKERTEQARLDAEQQKARAEKRLAREKERMAKEEARRARASAAREARLEKERREAEAHAAKREAALTEKARQAEQRLKETRAAERRAQEAAKRAQADAREQLLLEQQARALEEQAVTRAATALSDGVGMGPARASTRTSLEVPQRGGTGAGQSARKRQPGEPNFYSLSPFRNTRAVRDRAGRAGNAARRLSGMGALAVAALAALTGAFLNYSPAPVVGYVNAVAVTPAGGPVLLAGNRLFLHNRAGAAEAEVALPDLGVAHLYPPLAFDTQGAMLALGATRAGEATQMLRCDVTGDGCSPLPGLPDDVEVATFTENPVNGELFLLDVAGGALLKTDSGGEVLARAELDFPERPALRLQSGLLLLNSSEGPGIRVLRYDDSAFGRQLDEILLLPPPAAAAGHVRVGDFLFSGGSWWVTLYNPDNDSAGLYRFDSQWNYLDEAALRSPSLPLTLTNWGDKTLVNDGRDTALARFNSSGGVEVPLTSQPLEDLADSSRLRSRLLDSAWRIGLVALGLAAVLAFIGAYLQRLRHMVYRGARERGAEPIDDLLDNVAWISAAAGREKTLRTRLFSYTGIVLAVLLIAVGQRVGALELAALLLFLSGPAVALALLARSPPGHLGVAGERLLLVEPSGTYHLGGGSNLLYRGNLLFIDDVALYTGSRLLPAFSADEISSRVEPLVEGGVCIDARTALTRLLQSRHPLARGIAVTAACTLGALTLLLAGGMF